MSQNYITDNLPRVEQYLRSNRLRDALSMLLAMSRQASTNAIADAVERLEQDYAYMLGYLAKGVDDPQRRELHGSLISRAYRLRDRLERHTLAKEKPTLYYDALRYRARMRGSLPTLSQRVADYMKVVDNLSLFNMATGAADDTGTTQRYVAEEDIFTYIWTVFPLEGDDADAVRRLLTDTAVPADFRRMVVSALMMGELEFHDEERLLMLADVYAADTDNTLAIEALTGLVLGLHKYRHRPLSRRLQARLEALTEMPSWHSDITMLQLELIRARDTERINTKMRDEVIPQMLKMRPDIMRKIQDISEGNADDATIDENPEWERMMADSGLRDRLKEFGELQMEGSDVMMSTFLHLKTYPFFRGVANWFRPFSADFPDVRAVMADSLPGAMADLLEHASFFCDSDKYSFVLTLEKIPEAQKRMMLSQIEAQSANIAEAASAMMAATDRRTAANNYLHNIYRFFKLYRRRGEFYDPFARPVSLLTVPLLAPVFVDAAPLRLIAELYMRFHAYEEALEVFRRLLEHTPPAAELFQKIGYCLERTGHAEEALTNYRQAELFDARSVWTLRRLAAVSKLTGHLDDAAEYYRRLEQMLPDDKSVALNLGNVYAEMEMYPEAVKQYYKVNFLDEHSMKPVRPLAWCLFLTGDYQAAARFYERILADKPTADDYLNRGHLALACGDLSEAIGYYRRSVEASDGSMDTFLEKFEQDRPYLLRAGVDTDSLPMLADAVFYSL